MNKASLCTQLDIAEITLGDFQQWIVKDAVASAVLSWTACSGEVSSHDWGRSSSPRKGPYGEKLRVPANNQQQLSGMRLAHPGSSSAS